MVGCEGFYATVGQCGNTLQYTVIISIQYLCTAAVLRSRGSVQEKLYVDKDDRIDDLLGVGGRVEQADQAAGEGRGGTTGGHQGLHLVAGVHAQTDV